MKMTSQQQQMGWKKYLCGKNVRKKIVLRFLHFIAEKGYAMVTHNLAVYLQKQEKNM